MTKYGRSLVDRRGFLKAAGVTLATSFAGMAGIEMLSRAGRSGSLLKLTSAPTRQFYLAATDGWVSVGDPAVLASIAPFWPDPAAPAPYDLWIMGFIDVSDVHNDVGAVFDRKQGAQMSAPLIFLDEGENISISLRNLGLAKRPDLVDSHTIHFHGFPNQTPYFDGVPDSSLAAPIGRELVYQYIPEDAGTYMYHCHFEDVEHVHMGLQGQVFVRPKLGPNFVYNDPGTRFDRQFAIHLGEIDAHTHYNDAHLQISDWSAYQPNFRIMNGRSYPDTTLPNYDVKHPAAYSSTDPAPGSIQRPANYPPRLIHNPLSSLIQANAGEKVLIRLSNLGYEEHSLVLPGIPFTIIGQDAKSQLSGRPDYYGLDPNNRPERADISRTSYRVDLGPGESRELLFTAPAASGTGADVYPFFDRNYGFVATNPGQTGDGYGGMRTEVRIWPAGTLPAQPSPHALVDPL